MATYNPLIGMTPTPRGGAYASPNGANPSVDLSPPALLGAAGGTDTAAPRTHLCLGGLLVGAMVLIALIHLAGFRTHFTIGAGS